MYARILFFFACPGYLLSPPFTPFCFFFFLQNDSKDPTHCHYEATETVRNILKKQLLTADLFQQTFLSTILSALDSHTVNNDSKRCLFLSIPLLCSIDDFCFFFLSSSQTSTLGWTRCWTSSSFYQSTVYNERYS